MACSVSTEHAILLDGLLQWSVGSCVAAGISGANTGFPKTEQRNANAFYDCGRTCEPVIATA